ERHSLQLEDRSVSADVDPSDAALSQLRRRIVRHEFACAVIALQHHVEMGETERVKDARALVDRVRVRRSRRQSADGSKLTWSTDLVGCAGFEPATSAM